MKSSGKKLSLTSYDDIFTTEDARQEDQRERVMEIPLDKLRHFHDHPFQVRHDQALQDMADSIREYGVLSPGLARPLPDGSGYEVISGNRRLEACILVGMETMPVIVRDMTDDEAIIAMVDANLQRENILPSERAYAYKMKLDAIRRQAGRPSKDNSRQVVGNFRVSKKWLNATFLSFTGFASRIRSRAAKSAKYENLWVFIRSDAHVVRAGLNIRGCGPLSTPGFFDRL